MGGKAIATSNPANDGQGIIAAAIQAFGRIDAIIHNDGDYLDCSWAVTERSQWDAMLATTFRGGYKVC